MVEDELSINQGQTKLEQFCVYWQEEETPLFGGKKHTRLVRRSKR